jgi:hypothetical protein
VAGAIVGDIRDLPGLTQKHFIVSLREPDPLVRDNLLQRAEDEGLNATEFEKLLPPPEKSTPPPGTKDDLLHQAEVENHDLQALNTLNQIKLDGLSAMNGTVEGRLRDLETRALTGDLEPDEMATELHSIRDDMVTQVSIISDDDGQLSQKVVEAISLWNDNEFEQLAEVMDELSALVGLNKPVIIEMPEQVDEVPVEAPDWMA